jgi:hypothetical protein
MMLAVFEAKRRLSRAWLKGEATRPSCGTVVSFVFVLLIVDMTESGHDVGHAPVLLVGHALDQVDDIVARLVAACDRDELLSARREVDAAELMRQIRR